ncbi:hypothetical protein AGR4B_pAt20385 [Agrobacterium tumefaciens str. CFBP 5621]|nr:hypothetical protein AGR4B_pAt20385 [Agrobacterium tumefaciens str. CFBP 5621]
MAQPALRVPGITGSRVLEHRENGRLSPVEEHGGILQMPLPCLPNRREDAYARLYVPPNSGLRSGDDHGCRFRLPSAATDARRSGRHHRRRHGHARAA